MNVVIADMRQNAIDDTLQLFEGNGRPVFRVPLDFSDRVAYKKAVDAAGAVFPIVVYNDIYEKQTQVPAL